jgi:hypothetical protein
MHDDLGRIFYKSEPMDFDSLGAVVDDSTHIIYIARNRLHRWWLRRRYPEVADDIVLLKMLKGGYDLSVDMLNSIKKEVE